MRIARARHGLQCGPRLPEYPIGLRARIDDVVARFRWPQRRARLPGRGRVRELVRDPGSALARARPRRLRRIGRIGDEERLIGLLMVRDEDDVLAESLAAATRWFDRILVLDGTTDPDRVARTDAVLASFPEVVWHARDSELFPDGITDGARQVLLDEARRRYGVDHWIGILHADEFLDQDPRPMLAVRHPSLDPSLRVRVAHTFLHPDDAHLDATEPRLRRRVRHQMWPGVPESRFFFDDGSRDFDPALHSKVLPRSFRPGPLVDGYVITQYNERDPDRLLERARQRAASGWQVGHYARLLVDPPRIRVATLDGPAWPFAPEFAGDPAGPFRPRKVASCPHGPLPGDPAPLVVVTGAVDGHARLDAVEPAALLRLVEHPSRVRARRWVDVVRAGGADRDVVALARHTAAVVGSHRASASQRSRTAAEFLRWLPSPADPWTGGVAAELVEPVSRLLARHFATTTGASTT